MSHDTMMDWIGLVLLIALIGIPCWLVWRRRARNALSDEIMNRVCDDKAMSRSIAGAGGDRQKVRKHYVRERLRHLKREKRREVISQAFSLLVSLWAASVFISAAYAAYTGDLFWWWNGGTVSRETVIGLLWTATLVLVPYMTYSFAARRRVSRARVTGEVLGATFAAFVLLLLFSTAIANMLPQEL